MGGNQHFIVGADGSIVNNEHCVQSPDELGGPIITAFCGDNLNQEFIYSKEVRIFTISLALYLIFFLAENIKGTIY